MLLPLLHPLACWNCSCINRLLWNGMVASLHRPEHLRHIIAARGKSMDMPRRRCLLQRVHHLGSGGSGKDVHQSRYLPGDELVLRNWPACPCPLLVPVAQIPGQEVDQVHQHADPLCSHGKHATGKVRELHHVGGCWDILQLLCLQKVQGPVGKAQLHPIGRS